MLFFVFHRVFVCVLVWSCQTQLPWVLKNLIKLWNIHWCDIFSSFTFGARSGVLKIKEAVEHPFSLLVVSHSTYIDVSWRTRVWWWYTWTFPWCWQIIGLMVIWLLPDFNRLWTNCVHPRWTFACWRMGVGLIHLCVFFKSILKKISFEWSVQWTFDKKKLNDLCYIWMLNTYILWCVL